MLGASDALDPRFQNEAVPEVHGTLPTAAAATEKRHHPTHRAGSQIRSMEGLALFRLAVAELLVECGKRSHNPLFVTVAIVIIADAVRPVIEIAWRGFRTGPTTGQRIAAARDLIVLFVGVGALASAAIIA